MKNQIKNIEGRSTSSEEAPEYFGAKGALSLKNENIMCDIVLNYLLWQLMTLGCKLLRLICQMFRSLVYCLQLSLWVGSGRAFKY